MRTPDHTEGTLFGLQGSFKYLVCHSPRKWEEIMTQESNAKGHDACYVSYL